MINQIKIEIKIMYGLHHANIVKLFNHFEENDYIYLIIEFAEGVSYETLSFSLKFLRVNYGISSIKKADLMKKLFNM